MRNSSFTEPCCGFRIPPEGVIRKRGQTKKHIFWGLDFLADSRELDMVVLPRRHPALVGQLIHFYCLAIGLSISPTMLKTCYSFAGPANKAIPKHMCTDYDALAAPNL